MDSISLRLMFFVLFFAFSCQKIHLREEVEVFGNTFLKTDPTWAGADGAASIMLREDLHLWLFSDTFLDPDSGFQRSEHHFIRNSIALQYGRNPLESEFKFFTGYNNGMKTDFFQFPSDSAWFWTGHGVLLEDHLVIFLMEVKNSEGGLGFEVYHWRMAIVSNPFDTPYDWDICYVNGVNVGKILGSSAVIPSGDYLYIFGIEEPESHEISLYRIVKASIGCNDIAEIEQWGIRGWENIMKENKPVTLFTGQTEFSVHYDAELEKFFQVQTVGFGHASIGYRTADELSGPWTELKTFYTPRVTEKEHFIYTANAHSYSNLKGIYITYNVNSFSVQQLLQDSSLYYPYLLKLKFTRK